MDRINNNKVLWTTFLGMIFSIVFCASFINYLLNPGAVDRDQQVHYVQIYLLSNMLVLTVLIVYYAFFYTSQNMAKLDLKFYLVVTAWIFTGQVIIFVGRSCGITVWRFVLLTELMIFIFGYLFFAKSSPEDMLKVINKTYVITMLILSLFTYYVYSNNLLLNRSLLGFNFSPQLENDILQSTEMSNFYAQVFIIGYTLLLFLKYYNINYCKKMLLYTSLGLLFLIIVYLFSTATLIALFIIVVFSLQSTKFIKFSIAGGMGLIVTEYLGCDTISFLNEWYLLKSNEEARPYMYAKLINVINDNTLSGVGIGASNKIFGFYPHQNLLGTFAEGGITLFLFYVALMLFPLFIFVKLRETAMPTEHRMIFLMAVYSLFFWHFKGFVEDTWYQPEVYLWTGMLCAVYHKYSICKYTYNNLSKPI